MVRTTIQALAAVLGGTQSLHTNSYDEAMGLPTDESALLALRTQQVIAHESGVADTVDPLGGSYFVEYLTDRLEESAQSLLARIEDRAARSRLSKTAGCRPRSRTPHTRRRDVRPTGPGSSLG